MNKTKIIEKQMQMLDLLDDHVERVFEIGYRAGLMRFDYQRALEELREVNKRAREKAFKDFKDGIDTEPDF